MASFARILRCLASCLLSVWGVAEAEVVATLDVLDVGVVVTKVLVVMVEAMEEITPPEVMLH